MKNGNITKSTGFQVFLYVLLAAGAFLGSFSILLMIWLMSMDAYSLCYEDYIEDYMRNDAGEHLMKSASYETSEALIRWCEEESARYNVQFALYREEENELIWSNTDFQNEFFYPNYERLISLQVEQEIVFEDNMVSGETTEKKNEENYENYENYRIVMYVDTTFEKNDALQNVYSQGSFWYREKTMICVEGATGILLCLFCFIWLLCNAGHHWKKEGVVPGVLSSIYLDWLTGFFGAGAILLLLLAWNFVISSGYYPMRAAGASVVLALEAVWCTMYMRELALRFKLGKWWKHTFIYKIAGGLVKVLRICLSAFIGFVVHIPEIYGLVTVVFIITFCEFWGICLWGRGELFSVWFAEKLVLIPIVLYCGAAFQMLRKRSKKLAQGELVGKQDNRYLFLHFKEFGENLNHVDEGISKAVEEQMRSERLKTELITNVSHDLKTPLTSVINYADLLSAAAAGEGDEREKQITEYSEVLLRQAQRLKKLLEDLVEASKAATGNVELKLQPCELGVMLTQAAGEYEERFSQKNLKLIMKKPEEEVVIWADGRQLWRVFENLLNNICKYAQEDSRVYLSMERKEMGVNIIFRNISAYELDVSPQELTERFVRGDVSRHMEGSGLGLSIAKSLTELQKGTLEVITDGDLFKVILSFPVRKSDA